MNSSIQMSAVICTHNRTPLLLRALSSLEQSRQHLLEIVVIDNAPSSTETQDQLKSKFPNVRYVCEPRQGLNVARNRALQEAQGDVVAYLDDDAVADKHWAENLKQVFIEDPQVALCSGRVEALTVETEAEKLFEANGGFDRGVKPITLPKDVNQRLHGHRASLMAWAVSVGNGSSFAVRKAVVLGLGGFDEALDKGAALPGGGDLDVFWRVLEGGHHLRNEPTVLAKHEHRQDLPSVYTQIAGHQRALIAFLVKSLNCAKPENSHSIRCFLVWRLLKPWFRCVKRCFGMDPLPLSLLVRMGRETFSGLWAYQSVERKSANTLLDIWQFRELLVSLVARNLMIKYKRSIFGFVWTGLNPLMMVAVLSIVFSHVVRIEMHHYIAFLVSGYFVWNFIMQTFSAATFMLSEHAQLTRSVNFPKEIPVVASVFSKLVEFLVELVIVLIALMFLHYTAFPMGILWLPWLIAMLVVMLLGFSLPIAALSIFYRDIEHVLPILLTALFYVSPVFYPLDMVPEELQKIYLINPLAQLLTAFHQIIYEGIAPSMGLIVSLTVTSLIVFFVGYSIFNRYKEDVSEVI